MANPEHVEIAWQGMGAIASWRTENPDTLLDLSAADLFRAMLSHADLRRTNLSGADLSEAILERADLSGANLSAAILGGAEMSEANLREANLSRACLIGANMSKANLSEAILTEAILWDADMSEAYLNGANLRDARLTRVNLSRAKLGGASIERAALVNASFANVDLSDVRGLESVNHLGPSSIGIDTLYMSQGKIPEAFLRGCGVPEALITYLPSLIGAMEPIQFQSCFISYSSKDDEFAKRLYDRMRGEKLRVWFDQEDMQGGKKVMEQIDRAIQVNDRLLLVLSESSLKSEWVKTEIRKARRVERSEGRRKLFPIRLVSVGRLEKWKCLATDPDEDLAAEVRSYHIPDFSNWKDHDAFEAAFADLLRDLRAEA